MTGFKGKRNMYTCDKCHESVVTLDIDDGTTPAFIGCNATDGCDGMMQSSLYRRFSVSIVPHFIWRKPTKKEYMKASQPMKHHFDMGGLDLYPAPQRAARQ